MNYFVKADVEFKRLKIEKIDYLINLKNYNWYLVKKILSLFNCCYIIVLEII